jgi:hypothetical protein
MFTIDVAEFREYKISLKIERSKQINYRYYNNMTNVKRYAIQNQFRRLFS